MDEPFLITWNGIKQRRTSWEDGVLGTNCPILPKTNWTYKFQVKDQIGTYTYFPSTKFHRAAGAFGGFNIAQRSVVSIPYPTPAGEFTLIMVIVQYQLQGCKLTIGRGGALYEDSSFHSPLNLLSRSY